MLFKQPPGGLPGVPEGACILARVPIYGTKDAGRKFWKRLRTEFLSASFEENRILKALYSYADESGDVKIMVGTHVDDLIWACKPGDENMIQGILEFFDMREGEENEFRFCGREYSVRQVYGRYIRHHATACLLPWTIKCSRFSNHQKWSCLAIGTPAR